MTYGRSKDPKYLSGRGQSGVTLIELMIAMAIGLIMMLAVSRVYLANSTAARESEGRADLVDKVRLLHERFNYELRRADFWGRVPADAERQGQISIGNDCGDEFAYGRDTETPSTRPLGIWASNSPPSDCSLTNPQENQEYLAVRYAAESCGAGGCDDATSLKSFYPYIAFVNGSEPAVPEHAGADDIWRYGGSLYYLSKNEKALRRLWLQGNSLSNQEVMRGVEALAYQWWIDNDADGSVDVKLSTDQLVPTQMTEAIAVEVEAVLSVETLAAYQESREYVLSNGTAIESQPGKMYRRITFVVPLEMHRAGSFDE